MAMQRNFSGRQSKTQELLGKAMLGLESIGEKRNERDRCWQSWIEEEKL